MDIPKDPVIPADPTHTLATDPIPSTDPAAATVPLPPERPEPAPAVAPAVPVSAPAPVPPPLPRHDPAPTSGFNGPRPGWWNVAEAAAATEGVNSDTLWKIAGIESGFGRNMKASTSSASGPFQITDETWDQIARLNPSLGLTNKADLGQHGKAAAALLKANTVVLRGALGRTPTDGEQYLAWFGGSSAGVKAAQAPADTPVSAIFSPAAIAANRSILGNGMTVGGLRRWADAKMAGQHYAPAQGDVVDPLTNPSGGVGWDTLSPQMPTSDAQKAILSNTPPSEDVWSLTHAAAEATTHDNMVAQIIRNSGLTTPDPNYLPTAAAIAADPRASGIDKSHYSYLLGAQSDADMGQRIDALKDDLLYQRKMAERGWAGTAIRTAVSLADPAGFLLGAVSPVGSVAGKFGTMARILATGAEGAAINTGMEATAPSPSEEHSNYLGAAASGFLFGMGGGALGAIMHPHPAAAPAFKLMSDSAQSILDDVTSGVPGRAFGSTAGAEQSLGHVEPVRGDVSDFTSRLFTDAETGKAALTSAFGVPTRFDLAGMTKGSENPLTAALGSRMVEDAVGNADHSAVNRAVSVEATMIRERQDTALARAYLDAWGEFRNRNGITVGQRATAEAQFRDAIADAIDNVDPTQAHDIDPAVTRAADAYRRNFADFHELAQNPGILDGSVMAPLKGMAEVEANPRYFPHIYDFLAFGEHVRRFGDVQMKGLLRDSILSHVPEMAPEDAERVASGLYKGLRNVQAGQEVSMSRMLSGDDQEGLRGFLAAETDMSREAIDRVIGALNPPEQKGTIARTKRATPINVHYEAALKDTRTGETVPVKAKDFMERDAVRVGSMYNRQMAAQVALARLRVENPRWREGEMVPKPYGPEEHLNDPATGKAFTHKRPTDVAASSDAIMPEARGRISPEGVERGPFLEDGLNYYEATDGYHVSTAGLPNDLRGKGTGIEMYRMLAEQAQREGKVLHSDAQLSPDSFKVYQKLKAEGYDVRQHPDLEFHEWESRDGDAGVQTPGQEFPVFSIHPDPVEMIREVDPNNPRYLVDGIRGASEMDTLLKKVRAIGDELGHDPEATAKDVDRLQFMYDAITGRLTSDMDRGKLGQFVRILKALNFTRVMNQVGFAQIAETWTGVAQVGIRAALSSMPELRQFLDGIRGGRGQTDLALQLEHMATPGTEMLRGSMHLPVDDLHNAAGRTGTVMDRAEHFLHKATRATSIISGMAPFTAYQSKWMAKAALARFAMDATGEKALNTKRMRVLGISEDEQALIREQLRIHDGYVEGESGTQHRILNLDAWDPKARHALEYGLHVWVRKMIQENDIGQMNMMLGSSMGRLMGQFRMFMFGAYTKNTLHNIHMRDFETLSGILGGSVMGAATYAAQMHLQSLGRSDREEFLKRRVGLGGLASAAVSRGAFSSILPMVADLGTYAMGTDPLFDTRVSGGAAQGVLSSPVVGLGNTAFDALHGIGASLRGDGAFNQRDARAIQGLLPFSNFLPVVWAANAMIGGLPNRDTHKHWN